MKKSLQTFLLLFIFIKCAQPKTEFVNSKAVEDVTKFNKKCPMMIDSETRIDAIEIKKPNTIIYKYTLVNLNVANVDTILFKETLRPGIINTLKINPDLKGLRDLKANFEYYYKDRKNKYIYSFTVTPNDYKLK